MGLCAPAKSVGTSSPLPSNTKPSSTPARPSKKKVLPSPIYRPITKDRSIWRSCAAPSGQKPSSSLSCTRTTSWAPSSHSKKSADWPPKPMSTYTPMQCNPRGKSRLMSTRWESISSPFLGTNCTRQRESAPCMSAAALVCASCSTADITSAASARGQKTSPASWASVRPQRLPASLLERPPNACLPFETNWSKVCCTAFPSRV